MPVNKTKRYRRKKVLQNLMRQRRDERELRQTLQGLTSAQIGDLLGLDIPADRDALRDYRDQVQAILPTVGDLVTRLRAETRED